MSHSHDHRHDDRRSLAAATVLIAGLMVVEVATGVIAGSLALLADAGHMLTDLGALVLALAAAGMARRPAGGRWTFGFGRVEILAAQANGVALGIVAVLIVYSAVQRLSSPPEVRGGIVLAVALVGVGVNLAATLLLARGSRRSLNMRGAFLHAATDLAAFAGTAVAGAVILATGWDRADPIASLAVAALMLWSCWSLVRDSSRILLETSGEIDPTAIAEAILIDPDVVEVHDLHVWTVTSGFPALAAHVLVRDGGDCHAARRRIEGDLSLRFGLTHTTLQVEHAPPQVLQLRRWR